MPANARTSAFSGASRPAISLHFMLGIFHPAAIVAANA